jgi:gas vesicle protein
LGRPALGAFILGAAAGAAFALLYAPATGAETRSYLSRRTRDGLRRANDAMETGLEAIESGRSRMSSAMEEGRARLKNLKTRVQGAVDESIEHAERFASHAREAAADLKE